MKEEFYKTAVINQDVGPFLEGDFVSVQYQFHALNKFKDIGLQAVYNVWSGSGEKYPIQLYENALKDFVF